MNIFIKYIVPAIMYPLVIASAYYGLNGNEFAWNIFLLMQWLAVILAPIVLVTVMTAGYGTLFVIIDNRMGDKFKPVPSVISTGFHANFDIVFDIVCIIILGGKGNFVLAVLVFLQALVLAFTRFYTRHINEYLENKFNEMQLKNAKEANHGRM